MDSSVVRCMHCGQANRVPGGADGKKVVCGKCKASISGDRHPVAVSDADFDAMVSSGAPMVVDFWAAWCGPCRQIAPVIEELSKDRPDVIFAKLDVDSNQRTASQFKVSGIPTLVFFKGGAEKGRVVGAVGRRQIEQAIGQYLS